MKAYIITTGVIFGLLTVAHVVRIVTEDRQLVADPMFVLFTAISAALSVWSWLVLRRSRR
jgi:hypothetical protein